MRPGVRTAVTARRTRMWVRAELLSPPGCDARLSSRRRPKLLSALAAAVLGTVLGFVGAMLSGRPAGAAATLEFAARQDLRDAPLTAARNVGGGRAALIAEILAAGEAERFEVTTNAFYGRPHSKARLVIIFDDMGLDRHSFEEVMALPGPVTLSFLPYGRDLQSQVDAARTRGDDIMLHLPMEPSGGADPGPGALSTAMNADRLFEALASNLDSFEGYVAINNHMGSKFTRNEQAMKRILAMIDQRGLLFIDSLTTGGSVASKAGAAVGAEVFVRDVFLDAEPGRATVERQLALAEEIAVKTGYAIVICHPRRDTLDIIGPWLTTAPARGFELATVSSLREIEIMTASNAP